MSLRNCLLGLLLAGALPLAAAEGQPDAAAVKFFEGNVRPVLANRCFQCHGPEKQKNRLRLDSREAMLRGGSSGPAIKPGKPEESLLIGAIRHGELLQMPPKMKLPAQEIADLTAWVTMGAPWPNATAAVRPPAITGPLFTQEERSFWAFQPPVAPPVPPVRNTAWTRSPLDHFILARLEERGLQPAPAADRRTLIRRATFDLTGLPPTPAEIDAFLADSSPDAFARVVDRLLASPHYGERWGRHWLDVARYADSNGMDENLAFGNAFRYRDYVVASFNRDKPYDQFVREQLAGDLLPVPGDEAATLERLIATGFLSLGPKMLAEDDPVKMQMDIVDEQIDTVGRTFLGLTLGCARCHDHKFDPIPTADYYALAGVFKSTKTMDNFKVVARWHERPTAPKADVERFHHWEKGFTQKKAELERRTRHAQGLRLACRCVAGCLPAGGGKLPLPLPELVALQTATETTELKRAREELAALEKLRPALPEAMAVEEGQVANVCIHLRGSHLTQGAEVPRQFPRILAGEKQVAIDGKQSGRLQLAEWLTRTDHPLTSRVMVNRIWHWHFGAGLVRTPDNFGKLGDRPVNQPLLDWLAVRFVEEGWSIKALHRLILLSSTYQMSTAYNDKAAQLDPENRLHWRMNRRRLEAEVVRDSLLAVSGQLDRTMGGSLFQGNNRAYVPGYPNSNYERYDFNRRSIYLPVIRSDLYNVFQAFDFADPSVPNGERATTTVAPQALFMMNSKLMLEQTRHMAQDLLNQPGLDDAGRVRLAYLTAYGRPPTEKEATRALEFLGRYRKMSVGQKVDSSGAWQSLCRVLLASNEFIYVE